MRFPHVVHLFAALGLVACADLQPGEAWVTGKAEALSSGDVAAAIAAAKKGAFGYQPKGLVYRVHVFNKDRLQVFFGLHYGIAEPLTGAGEVSYIVKRIRGRWQARGIATPGLSLSD